MGASISAWQPMMPGNIGADLGLAGAQEIRHLWRQKTIGTFTGVFETEAPRHGLALLRVSGK